MKKISITFAVALFSITMLAQNSNLEYNYAIKICNLATYEEDSHTRSSGLQHHYNYYNNHHLQLIHPVVAFQWKSKKNNFQEIELNDLKWEHTGSTTESRSDSTGMATIVDEQRITESAISAKYEYTFVFLKKKEHKLVPTLGLAADQYYRQYHFAPGVSSSFPSKEIVTGARVLVTPGLSLFLKHRLFIDVKIPLCIADAHFLSDDQEDPSVAKSAQKVSSFDMNMFPRIFSARLGIGVRL
jgi:hypothetical protein